MNIKCPHCESRKKSGTGYKVEISKGVICLDCNSVMFPTNEENAIKVVGKTTKARQETGNRPNRIGFHTGNNNTPDYSRMMMHGMDYPYCERID